MRGRLLGTDRLDVTDGAAYAALVARQRPRAIVRLAALTPLGRVPPALACRTAQVNILGPLHAVAAALPGCFLVVTSSDFVFGAAGFDAPALAALTGFRAAHDVERAVEDDLIWRRAAAN